MISDHYPETKGVWRRGAKTVTPADRNWCYLTDIEQRAKAALNRIRAGDVQYATMYAKSAAHWAGIYLRGER